MTGAIGLLAVIGLTGVGCRAQAGQPAGPSSPPTTTFLVKETALREGVVDVRLEIPLSPEGPKPVIIGAIGGPHPVLRAGFVAATFTIHWNRVPGAAASKPPPTNAVGKWVLASPSAGVLGESYLRGIAATATEYVPAIIDWLETVPEVDASRIGIAGSSTNGFIALQAAADDHRIRAAAAIAACGDYHGFLRDSSMGMHGAPLLLDPSYDAWVRGQEIIHDPQRMVHAAVLVVNYDGDELIPIACADETAAALSRAYAAAGVPERFHYTRREQSGHGLSPRDGGEMLAWFERWLRRP